MNDLDKITFICSKLQRLDSNAAEYVMEQYEDNNLWCGWQDYYNMPEALSSLFMWSRTPQGTYYWLALHKRYMQLKNVTKLGNYL